jgi:hypothetical protein
VFAPETLATFIQLVTMVEELNGLFEPDGDKEADTNRSDVDEKRPPGVDAIVRGVDIEHRRGNLWAGIWLSDCGRRSLQTISPCLSFCWLDVFRHSRTLA